MSEPDAEYNVARADDAARPLAKGRATRAGIEWGTDAETPLPERVARSASDAGVQLR